jgi:hypothetical protein
MCDYSLQAFKSRPAVVADALTTKNFGMGTTGFAAAEDTSVAVCVLPGTELAFATPVVARTELAFAAPVVARVTTFFLDCATVYPHQTAIFRQTNKDNMHAHHDCLEFPDGVRVLLTALAEDQKATVLQLPAAPKTEAEAKDQTRVAVVA